jgi:hypothetical protein
MQSIATQIGAQVLIINDLDEHYLQNMGNVAIELSKA